MSRDRGTLICVLCGGLVSYRNGDTRRFNEHMNIEHGAQYNLRYILAGSLMSELERNIVAEIIEERIVNIDGTLNEGSDIKCDVINSVLDTGSPLDNGSKLSLDAPIGENLEKPIKCHLCDFRCAKSRYLTQHLGKKHKLSKEERGLINDTVINVQSIGTNSFHMSIGEPGDIIRDLPKLEANEDEIDYENEKETNDRNKCDLCKATFHNYSNMKRHQLSLHKEEVFPNDEYCPEIVTPKATNLESESEPIDKNKCLVCDASFSNVGNLNRHMRLLHSISKEEDKYVENVTLIKKNIDSKSEDVIEDKVFKCEHCDFSCVKSSRLKFHKTMKHKPKEKAEEKLVVSKTLFTKKSAEVEDKLQCGKCDFSSHDAKELRYHRFRNHRHAFMKRSTTVEHGSDANTSAEEDLISQKDLDEYLEIVSENQANVQELLLNEESDVSLEVTDLEVSVEGVDPLTLNESIDKRNERSKPYSEKKIDLVEKSEHFKTHPKNISSWCGLEEDLLPVENLPQGWGVKNCVSTGGQKYKEYVTPDRVLRLRSMRSALEYIKCSD